MPAIPSQPAASIAQPTQGVKDDAWKARTLFSLLAPVSGRAAEGCRYHPLGVQTRESFFAMPLSASANAWPPPTDEELPEWMDLLEAVLSCERGFTFVELGAGYGRWLVRAAAACRRFGIGPVRLVGVEAEPSHFAMMKQHVADNDIEVRSVELINAAIDREPGEVPFHVGSAEQWYGQAIARGTAAGPCHQFPDATIETVEAVSVEQVLAPLDHVDLLDLDIQGVEFEVLEVARHALQQKVARVHIGTHSTSIETQLRDLFGELGWVCRHDYACGKTQHTPWGELFFGDGVQSWINPTLEPTR